MESTLNEWGNEKKTGKKYILQSDNSQHRF